jgi:hypothetical protein
VRSGSVYGGSVASSSAIPTTGILGRILNPISSGPSSVRQLLFGSASGAASVASVGSGRSSPVAVAEPADAAVKVGRMVRHPSSGRIVPEIAVTSRLPVRRLWLWACRSSPQRVTRL